MDEVLSRIEGSSLGDMFNFLGKGIKSTVLSTAASLALCQCTHGV